MADLATHTDGGVVVSSADGAASALSPDRQGIDPRVTPPAGPLGAIDPGERRNPMGGTVAGPEPGVA